MLYYTGTEWKTAQEKTKTNPNPCLIYLILTGNSISHTKVVHLQVLKFLVISKEQELTILN